jgi:hypothetical protein
MVKVQLQIRIDLFRLKFTLRFSLACIERRSLFWRDAFHRNAIQQTINSLQ